MTHDSAYLGDFGVVGSISNINYLSYTFNLKIISEFQFLLANHFLEIERISVYVLKEEFTSFTRMKIGPWWFIKHCLDYFILILGTSSEEFRVDAPVLELKE